MRNGSKSVNANRVNVLTNDAFVKHSTLSYRQLKGEFFSILGVWVIDYYYYYYFIQVLSKNVTDLNKAKWVTLMLNCVTEIKVF